MDIPYLIQLLQNKLVILDNAKAQAFSVGDIDGMNGIDKQILDLQNTLAQLSSLVDPTKTIAVATQGPSAGAVINGYDISAYATDPLYEQKIQSILSAMPPLLDAASIDAYIQTITPGSPVTGAMVVSAATLYNVNMPLLIAIMQNDSSFGTLGVGARTFNPGNVGNTGTAEQTYPSWQDGVNAVAQWLSNHVATAPVAQVTPVVPVVPIIPVTQTTTAADTTTAATDTTGTTGTTTTASTGDTSTTTTGTDSSATTATDTTTATTDTTGTTSASTTSDTSVSTTGSDASTTTATTGTTDTTSNSSSTTGADTSTSTTSSTDTATASAGDTVAPASGS